MDNSKWRLQSLAFHLFEYLLHLYPPRFRGEFSVEIRTVILNRMDDAEGHGWATWLSTVFQEIRELVISIIRECWHEFRVRKEKEMVPEDQLQKDLGSEGSGIPTIRPAGPPGALWFTGWTLLTTAAIPVALIVMPPLAVMFMWLIDLGVKAGFWPVAQQSTLELLGFLISFALLLASVQWFLLRRFLPKAWLWFIATGAGVLLSALAVGLSLGSFSVQSWDTTWIMAAVLLPFGLVLGLAQWLYLRRFLPNAFWIIFIDVLATGSILMAGESFTSLVELMVLAVPGIITGLGLLLLLKQTYPKLQNLARREASHENDRRLPRLVRIGMGVVAMVPLFFVCIWVYTASQLALAKNEGIYSTVEEAVIARNSRSIGGAEVVSIEDIWAEPNSRTAQPHVWFGGATVYLDRIPEGYNWDHYNTGSFYIHVREGWVHVSEGAFPEFIGWVMELYDMEAVNGNL